MEEIKKISVNGTEYVIEGVNLENVSYAKLKELRDSSNLVPGREYCITDYRTAVNSQNLNVAGNPFNVIVKATGVNTLSEAAKASRRKNSNLFSSSKIDSWELKYCLDNDTTRFDWASSSGTGVIYYMKDERGNECPYDFKNIKFKGNDNKYHFTFECYDMDYSVYVYTLSSKSTAACSNNIIVARYNDSGAQLLNYIYIVTSRENQDWGCQNNKFESGCAYIVSTESMVNCSFGVYCSNITTTNISNVGFGVQNKYITISEGMDDSSFGNFVTGFKFPQFSKGITVGNNNNNGSKNIIEVKDSNNDTLCNVYIASGVAKGLEDTIEVVSGDYTTNIYRDKFSSIKIHQYDSSEEFKDNSISGAKLIDSSITWEKLADEAVFTNNITNDCITEAKLSNDLRQKLNQVPENSVNTSAIVDSAITSNKIANKTITANKIADETITSDKFAEGAVNGRAINNNAVQKIHLHSEVMEMFKDSTSGSLIKDSVTTDKIKDGAVTEDKINDNAVQARHLSSGAIDSIKSIIPVESRHIYGTDFDNTAPVILGVLGNNKDSNNKIYQQIVYSEWYGAQEPISLLSLSGDVAILSVSGTCYCEDEISCMDQKLFEIKWNKGTETTDVSVECEFLLEKGVSEAYFYTLITYYKNN